MAHALTASAAALSRVGDREGAGIAVGLAEGIHDHLSMIVAAHEDRTTDVTRALRESEGVDVTAEGPARDEWDSARRQGRTMAADEGIARAISRLDQVAETLQPDTGAPQ